VRANTIVEFLGDGQDCCGHHFLDHTTHSQTRLGSLLRLRAPAVLGVVLKAHSLEPGPIGRHIQAAHKRILILVGQGVHILLRTTMKIAWFKTSLSPPVPVSAISIFTSSTHFAIKATSVNQHGLCKSALTTGICLQQDNRRVSSLCSWSILQRRFFSLMHLVFSLHLTSIALLSTFDIFDLCRLASRCLLLSLTLCCWRFHAICGTRLATILTM